MPEPVEKKLDVFMAEINKRFCVQGYGEEHNPLNTIRAKIRMLLLEQDRDTRHACAEALLSLERGPMVDDLFVNIDQAQSVVLNTMVT